MKALSVVILAFIVAGCSSIPAPDRINATSELEHIEPLDIVVENIPPSPTMVRLERDGQVYGGFDLAGMDDLLHMRAVARRNTDLLNEMIALNNALIEERGHLVEMAKELERLVNTMIDELYANEKSANRHEIFQRIERLSYQLGIIAVGTL